MIVNLKKALKFAVNGVFYLSIVLMIFMVFILVNSKMTGGVPTVAGNKLLVVLSGSMLPVFDAGSIIGVKDVVPENINVGDIVTFKDPEDKNRVITHRVMEINRENGKLSFITKGDANNSQDLSPVPEGNILGRATFWVPYMGYLVNFVKSKKGLLILIIVPGTLFILSELRNLYKYAVAYELEKRSKNGQGQIKP